MRSESIPTELEVSMGWCGTLFAESPEDALLRQEMRDAVLVVLDHATLNQRLALDLRWGIHGEALVTWHEVGKALGVSRERARQLADAGMRKMWPHLYRMGYGLGHRGSPGNPWRDPETFPSPLRMTEAG